jgi:RNA polymerase sigma-70 factor (ECF subfamily)
VQGSVRGWLFRVARNIAIDRLRARQAHPVEVDGANLVSIAVSGDHPEDVSTAVTLRDALNRLSPDRRVVLYECYYRGHSLAEAATVLGIPTGTVKSRLYYGLRNLREILQRQAVLR